LRTLYRHHWHVYSKRPFGGPEHALRYLAPLHPSRRHLQPSTRCFRQRRSYLSMARLRSQQ
jgi:hypothetical protein